jgi:tetratricopeptide (TPR) repeat protein
VSVDFLGPLFSAIVDSLCWYFVFKGDAPASFVAQNPRLDDRLEAIPDPATVCAQAFLRVHDEHSKSEAFFLRGLVNRKEGRYAEAAADFREVLAINPRHARAWLMLSEVLVNVNEYEQARLARQKALELDPSLA